MKYQVSSFLILVKVVQGTIILSLFILYFISHWVIPSLFGRYGYYDQRGKLSFRKWGWKVIPIYIFGIVLIIWFFNLGWWSVIFSLFLLVAWRGLWREGGLSETEVK